MGFYAGLMGFYGGLMGFYGGLMGFNMIYPLVNIQKAIENGPVEIVDFPINSMVDLSIAKCLFTRGYSLSIFDILTTCCPFHTSCCLLLWHLHDVCQIRVKRVLKLASFQVRTTQPWFFPVHLYRKLPGNWLVIPVGNSLRTIVY